MANLLPELDRMRAALAQLSLDRPANPSAEVLRGIGAPPGMQPGARIRDPVTGEEGVVIAYGRAPLIRTAPRT